MSGQIQACGCLSLGKKLEVTFSDHLPDPMLRCAVLSRCAGTAFHTNPQSLFALSTRHWGGSDFDRGLWRQTQRQLFRKNLPIRV